MATSLPRSGGLPFSGNANSEDMGVGTRTPLTRPISFAGNLVADDIYSSQPIDLSQQPTSSSITPYEVPISTPFNYIIYLNNGSKIDIKAMDMMVNDELYSAIYRHEDGTSRLVAMVPKNLVALIICTDFGALTPSENNNNDDSLRRIRGMAESGPQPR